VTLICLETKEDMPACDEEIRRAEEEGVVIHDGWGLGNVVTDDNGKVIGLDSKRCLSVRDADGRLSPDYDENDRVTYESDFILLATGQAVDLGFLGDRFLAQLKSARGLFAVDAETYRTSHKGIYAAGDAASGPNIAIRAIAGGRIAAMNMSKDLGVAIELRGCTKGFVHFDKAGAQEKQATAQTERPLAERSLTAEDASSYSPEQLKREIRRCTNCACYAVNQAETVPALLAMGAVIVTNEREIAAEEFFGVGVIKTTVLKPGEIVTEIRIPLVDGGVTGCYKRFSFRKSIDFPIINFAIVFDKDKNYRVWLGGVAPVPYHAEKAEAVLNGKDITEELAVKPAWQPLKAPIPSRQTLIRFSLSKPS
jgi:CO/xanthine dehydrogenase FAD-binding subunit